MAWSDLFKTGDSVTAGRGGLEQVGDGGQEATEGLSTRGCWPELRLRRGQFIDTYDGNSVLHNPLSLNMLFSLHIHNFNITGINF